MGYKGNLCSEAWKVPPFLCRAAQKSFSLAFNTAQVIFLISFDKLSLHKG